MLDHEVGMPAGLVELAGKRDVFVIDVGHGGRRGRIAAYGVP